MDWSKLANPAARVFSQRKETQITNALTSARIEIGDIERAVQDEVALTRGIIRPHVRKEAREALLMAQRRVRVALDLLKR